jgi:hypothetical protein
VIESLVFIIIGPRQLSRYAAFTSFLEVSCMSNFWINADFPPNNEGIAKKQRLRALIESKAQTLKEFSEQGRVSSISNVRCECGDTFPWKILTDGDGDLTEFARRIHDDIGEIVEADIFNVTVNVS